MLKSVRLQYESNSSISLSSFQQIYYGTLAVVSTVFSLAQRVKKKVKALFRQLVIHLARILGETVSGRPPDHQDDRERNEAHWWAEIENFVAQIQSEQLSEAQLRKIIEDEFGRDSTEDAIDALTRSAQKMQKPVPKLFHRGYKS